MCGKMKHLGTRQLETNRLILRAFCEKDAAAMYRNWASDSEVTRILTWPTHESEDVTKSLLKSWEEEAKKEDYYNWAIILKELGEPIGSISVVGCKEITRTAVIGYCIGRKWWNKGITSEAFKRVIRYLFDEVGMYRIEAAHDKNNPHSGMVMKKCGLYFEGILRGAGHNNQGICDMCMYGMLREDFSQN